MSRRQHLDEDPQPSEQKIQYHPAKPELAGCCGFFSRPRRDSDIQCGDQELKPSDSFNGSNNSVRVFSAPDGSWRRVVKSDPNAKEKNLECLLKYYQLECDVWNLLYGVDVGQATLVKLKKDVRLILPLLPGVMLDVYCRFSNKLQLQKIRCMRACMLEVQRLHQLGWVHRDLSGGNLIYDETSDRAYVIDFEFAAEIDLRQNRLKFRDNKVCPYIPPEAVGDDDRRGQTYIVRPDQDIYALCYHLERYGLSMFNLPKLQTLQNSECRPPIEDLIDRLDTVLEPSANSDFKAGLS